mmetsp:Transcript_20637/g.43775  ORF Transcript_20637/g.43775 Transcript_20637/m.43775 type:complete len:219 (-) Transcript_20637:842-1498(-)
MDRRIRNRERPEQSLSLESKRLPKGSDSAPTDRPQAQSPARDLGPGFRPRCQLRKGCPGDTPADQPGGFLQQDSLLSSRKTGGEGHAPCGDPVALFAPLGTELESLLVAGVRDLWRRSPAGGGHGAEHDPGDPSHGRQRRLRRPAAFQGGSLCQAFCGVFQSPQRARSSTLQNSHAPSLSILFASLEKGLAKRQQQQQQQCQWQKNAIRNHSEAHTQQ